MAKENSITNTVSDEEYIEEYTQAYNMYYPLVFSVVYSKIENMDDAYDICQNVFIDFFRKFKEVENHKNWLYGALRNAVFKFYNEKNSNVNIDDLFYNMGFSFVNGFKESRLIIEEAIENMEANFNEKDRALFELVAIFNYSYSAAGKQLGYTKRQVQHRYGKIVNNITVYLRKKGIDNLEDLL